MNKLRVVLDTNLVVSAALMERSFARQIFETALARGEILISNETQDELTEVLMRSKFDRYVSEEKRLLFLANFLSIAISTEVLERIQRQFSNSVYSNLILPFSPAMWNRSFTQ